MHGIVRMRFARFAVLTVLLTIATAIPAAAEAQERIERFDTAGIEEQPIARPAAANSTARLTGAGLLGGVVGAAAGGLASVAVVCRGDGPTDFCGLVAIPGAALGMTLGMPAGVHLANDRRGSLVTGILGTLAAGGAVVGLAALTDVGEIVLLMPAVQLVTAIGIERATADRY